MNKPETINAADQAEKEQKGGGDVNETPQELFDSPEADKAMRDYARHMEQRLSAPEAFKLHNTHAVEFLDSIENEIRRRMEADK